MKFTFENLLGNWEKNQWSNLLQKSLKFHYLRSEKKF